MGKKTAKTEPSHADKLEDYQNFDLLELGTGQNEIPPLPPGAKMLA